MSRPFIAAFKAGETSPVQYIEDEKIIYWYRPTLKDVDCDATDTTIGGNVDNSTGNFFHGRPDGWQIMQDEVFVVSLLKSPATVEVTSGDVKESFEAAAGASPFTVPMGVGQQKFAVVRDGETVLSGTSLKDIVNHCVCGIYNFNAYVGTVPPEETVDQLDSTGLAMLSQGLEAPCPTNTLAAGPRANG